MIILLANFSKVPAPAIQCSPNCSIYFYTGEDLNVTCISTVVGAVFTWRAVIFGSQQPVMIPNTTFSSGSNASIILFRPIRINMFISVELNCLIGLPDNKNIIGNSSLTYIDITGEIQYVLHFIKSSIHC